MGCGKSKHDVASGNTLLRRKKSSVKHNEGQENDNNDKANVNVSTGVEVQKEGDNVKEVVGGKADEVDSNGVKSKIENANVQEETVLEKSKEIVAGDEVKSSKIENANVGEEKVQEKSKEAVAGGDEVKSSKSENANVGEEKVLEKSEEVVAGGDEFKSKTENASVQEEIKGLEKKSKEVAGEEGLVPQEASEKSQGGEENTLKLKENDQKVNAATAGEKKTGDRKGM